MKTSIPQSLVRKTFQKKNCAQNDFTQTQVVRVFLPHNRCNRCRMKIYHFERGSGGNSIITDRFKLLNSLWNTPFI